MDTTTKLQNYRQLGLDRLEQLLLQSPDTPQEADYFVDRAIRQLTGLPPAPADAAPYIGIYSDKFTMEQYRDGATDRLEDLMMKLPGPDPLDAEVDRLIRVMTDLPPRPADVQPYERLFVLRTDDTPPTELDTDVAIPEVASLKTASQQFITLEQMLEIIGSTTLEKRVEAIMPGLNTTLEQFEINTPLRISHFLGQILHESGGLRWLREIWGPTDAQRRYEPTSQLSRNLGNIQAGDGKRYMGRGVIQLTGRSNYAQFSKAMGVDFVDKPELVELPQYAIAVGGWFWDTRKLNDPADRDDLLRVTRLINGGKNGLADRQKYLNRAKKVLNA